MVFFPKDCLMVFGTPGYHMSDGLNLLHPRKDMAEMVIVFCVSPIVPEGLVLWTWNEQVIEKKK